MKAVMISVSPKMCEKVASGDCTILVRKTRPKIETPFKCYIYCTKGKENEKTCFGKYTCHIGNGKVIGEFVCDKITDISVVVRNCNEDYNRVYHNDECKGSCLTWKELQEYGKGKTLYGWHISDLAVYDNPREIGEFFCKCNKKYCTGCEDFCDEGETIFRMCGGLKAVTRPPQSWQYVEEKENEK